MCIDNANPPPMEIGTVLSLHKTNHYNTPVRN